VEKFSKLAAVLTCLLFVSVGVSALQQCSTQAYTRQCTECGFDSNGKSNQACQDMHQNKGKACVGTTYPGASAKYALGMCPAVDACVNQLKGCVALKCPGSDLDDCKSFACRSCFEESDRCIARAAKDCDGKAKCNNNKCEKDKGETKETCCSDCGCSVGLVCKQNKCAEKPEEEPESEEETGGGSKQPEGTAADEPVDSEGAWNVIESFCIGPFGFLFGMFIPPLLILELSSKKRRH